MIGKNFIYSFVLATPQKSVTSLGNVLAVIVTVMCCNKGECNFFGVWTYMRPDKE